MKSFILSHAISLCLGVGGFILVLIFAPWPVAVGVFLMEWGYGLQLRNLQKKEEARPK